MLHVQIGYRQSSLLQKQTQLLRATGDWRREIKSLLLVVVLAKLAGRGQTLFVSQTITSEGDTL